MTTAEEQQGSHRVRRVVCPGSFDPVTNGHLDIISRAAGLYDEVIVAVLINVTKHSLFTVDERVEMLSQVTSNFGNVKIERFHGLLVDFCAANGISAVIKGLRAVSDFEYEMQMAQMNYRMAKVETLFMTTNPLYSFLSSSLVKEITRYGGSANTTSYRPSSVLSWPRAGAGLSWPPAGAGPRASTRSTRSAASTAPGRPIASMFSLITRVARAPCSTSSTCPAPRDRASRPTAPDPAYRSRTRAPASEPRIDTIVANRPSLARSLVGLVSRPSGTASRRPPASPAITRATP